MNRIFNVLMESTKLKIVHKSIEMLVALILYFVCDRSLRNRCKRAIKYFRIVPKEVMCSTKLTTFMRKQKVLSKFDILWWRNNSHQQRVIKNVKLLISYIFFLNSESIRWFFILIWLMDWFLILNIKFKY